jgi:DNA-binding CsgD family transcriptional regulator
VISPRLALLTEGSAGIAATELDGSFEKALAVPDAELWAFDLARVQLVYGERLRRAKETAVARPQLAAALDAFERLGARPWAQRAANELRATGITVGRPKVTGPEALSPQQLEIARLAATGLSNKEIGERLFLSHRTVSTHLYQIFPKLGISSRAALRDALEGHTADT